MIIPAQEKSAIENVYLIHYMREVKQMNMLKQLNAAIEYIEANLCAEFDLDTAAGIACVTADSFIRFFSYMTGMTLTEYVRRRRLTLAAQDLQYGSSAASAFLTLLVKATSAKGRGVYTMPQSLSTSS